MSITPAQYRELLAVIDGLYGAAVHPAKWNGFLAAAATLLDADNAYVSEIDHASGALEYIVLRPLDWNAISVARYAALMDEDPRMPAFRNNPYRPQHCRMVVSEKKLHASRTYIEALQPLGIEYTLVVGIPADADTTNFLGFTRAKNAEPFGAGDCELMSELVPHLARSFAIRRALGRKEPAKYLPVAPSQCLESREEVIGRLFDLPPSLRRVTALLMTGRNVKEIARELELTEGTTRQYLKLIFQRTGTRRQADLVRTVGDRLMQHF